MADAFGLSDVASLVLGTFIGAWFSHFLKRPKLAIVGGGSGGVNGARPLVVPHIRIQNVPGLFGINIRPTIIFGWKLHLGSTFGFSLDRSSARDCTAWLVDPDSREKLTNLFWRVGDDVRWVTDLGPGETAELLVFARTGDKRSSYFVLTKHDSNGFGVPPDDAWFTESRKFLVEIEYLHSRKLRFPVQVKKSLKGDLAFYSSSGGGTF